MGKSIKDIAEMRDHQDRVLALIGDQTDAKPKDLAEKFSAELGVQVSYQHVGNITKGLRRERLVDASITRNGSITYRLTLAGRARLNQLGNGD